MAPWVHTYLSLLTEKQQNLHETGLESADLIDYDHTKN